MEREGKPEMLDREFRATCGVQVWALNEAQAGSVHDIFRPWGDRLDMSLPTLDSNDDDPELLIHVPFSGTVKIKVRLPGL